MKKFLAAIAAATLVLTLSACSKDVTVDRGDIQSSLGVDEDTADCIGEKIEGELSDDEIKAVSDETADEALFNRALDVTFAAAEECGADLGDLAAAAGEG